MIDFRENEHIIFEVRKHWFIIATEIFVLLFLAIIPIIIPQILDFLGAGFSFSIDGQIFWPVYVFFYSFWLLLLWIVGFVFWTNYYLDVWIVTNEKIVDVDQTGLFSREISIMHLDKIQDMTTEVRGVVSTFLKFGDLHVQTAGRKNDFIIKGVADPDDVSERINEVLMKYKINI